MAKNNKFNRRSLFKGAGAGALLGSVPMSLNYQANAQDAAKEKKFLFVIAAAGGASIIDSFLAQTTGPAAYNELTNVNGSVFSAVPVLDNSIQGAIPLGNGYAQATFLQKHGVDTVVMTSEVSSVNHVIAAKRASTGDNINSGRTITEAAAMQFGSSCPLPNLGLSGGGYGLNGDDDIPAAVRAEPISDPLMFAFATHGFKGINSAMSSQDIAAARLLRRQIEDVSRYAKQNSQSLIIDAYRRNRDELIGQLEKGDVISKLVLLDPSSYDLSSISTGMSADLQAMIQKFPSLATDPFESKLALAFLAAKNGMSNAFTISPNPSPLVQPEGTPNPPIAFDWSHVDHRGAQNSMWSYILKGTDSLIELLKATDIDGDPAKGKMWDKSMIYIATEFGRDKIAGGGSGHHLNNGNVFISPMLNGNRIYGGIDAATGITYGFNSSTGEPDPSNIKTEKDVYSAVAHAMGIEFSGRIDQLAMVRNK